MAIKKSRFSETRIVSLLQQQQAGLSVADICRQPNISEATFYNWKAKYGGIGRDQAPAGSQATAATAHDSPESVLVAGLCA